MIKRIKRRRINIQLISIFLLIVAIMILGENIYYLVVSFITVGVIWFYFMITTSNKFVPELIEAIKNGRIDVLKELSEELQLNRKSKILFLDVFYLVYYEMLYYIIIDNTEMYFDARASYFELYMKASSKKQIRQLYYGIYLNSSSCYYYLTIDDKVSFTESFKLLMECREDLYLINTKKYAGFKKHPEGIIYDYNNLVENKISFTEFSNISYETKYGELLKEKAIEKYKSE